MTTLVTFLAGRGSLPVFLLLLAGFLHSLVVGHVSQWLMLLMLLAGGAQLVLQNYNKLYARLVPVELLDSGNVLRDKIVYLRLSYLLVLLPLLAVVSGWLAWAGFLLIALRVGNDFFRLFSRMLRRKQLEAASMKAIRDYRAPVIVYVSGLEDVAYQINQWIPVLEKLSVRSVILVRNRAVYQAMLRSEIPVVYARSMAHVETVLECGFQTVLYPANTQQNVQSLRHFRLNHFFINHGESDKAVNQSKLLMAYDKLLVAGPMAERRLKDAGLPLRSGQVVHVGRPQAEIGLQVQSAAPSIRKVLYAPTWEGFVDGVDYASVSAFGLALVKQLVESGRYQLIFKPHPYTGHRKEEQRRYLKLISDYCEKQGARVVDSLVPIYEVMNESDLLITDVSSVLNDYLITRKPVVLCVNTMMAEMDVESQFPSSCAAYKLRPGDNAAALIQQIENEDVMAPKREAVRRDSLGYFEESALAHFDRVITESLIDEAQ